MFKASEAVWSHPHKPLKAQTVLGIIFEYQTLDIFRIKDPSKIYLKI